MIPLFFGGELESFTTTGDVTENTTAGSYDSSYARCSIRINNDLSYADTLIFNPSTTDFFFGGRLMIGSFATSRVLVGFVNIMGLEVFRVLATGTAAACILQMQYLLAGVWTNVGSASAAVDFTTRKVMDIQLTHTGSGTATLYIEGASSVSATGTNLSPAEKIAFIRLRSPGVAYWSEVIGATYTTVGKRVITRYASANGSDTGWTGDYTAIDETVYSAADYIQADAPNLSESFSTSGGSATNTTVHAVCVGAKALSITTANATSADAMILGIRASGQNYYGTAIQPPIVEFPHRETWITNPATSAAWQSVEIADIQPGIKSAQIAPVSGAPATTYDPYPELTGAMTPEDPTLGRSRYGGKHIY